MKQDGLIENWVPKEALFVWDVLEKPRIESFASMKVIEDDNKIDPRYRNQHYFYRLHVKRCGLALINIPKLFTRFINGSDPQHLWESVCSSEDYSSWSFMCNVCHFYIGPDVMEESMSPVVKEKWLEEVTKTASHLGQLIGSSNLSPFLDAYIADISTDVIELIKKYTPTFDQNVSECIDSIFLSRRPFLTTVLYDLSKVTKPEDIKDWYEIKYGYTTYSPDYTSRPGDAAAHRNYFARGMTKFFGENTGKPNRKIVQILIDCLFEEGIDERKLIDVAPWPSDKG